MRTYFRQSGEDNLSPPGDGLYSLRWKIIQRFDNYEQTQIWEKRRKKVKQYRKRSSGPKTDLLGQTKRGARRLDMKNGGVKKLSSFIWTIMVKKENENGKGRAYIRQSGEDIFSTIR